MKKYKKLSALIALITSMSLVGCGNKSDNKITVAEVTHSIFYAPMYLASDLGYFKDEGLDVSFITTPGADKTMAALLSKEAHIALMGPEATVYVHKSNQKDYAINFAQLTQKDGSFLLGREKDDNFTYDKLKGKTIIGGRKGGMPEMTLEYVLKQAGLTITQNGVDPNADVNIRTDVSFDVMSGVFASGQSDYVTLFEPSASQMERLGKGYILRSLGEDSGIVPYTCFSSLKSYFNKNEEKLAKFTRAIKKGLDYIHGNEIKDIIPHLTSFFTSSDNEELTSVVKNYLDIEAWPKTMQFTESNFNKLLEIVKEAGELEKDYVSAYSSLVTNKIIEKI